MKFTFVFQDSSVNVLDCIGLKIGDKVMVGDSKVGLWLVQIIDNQSNGLGTRLKGHFPLGGILRAERYFARD